MVAAPPFSVLVVCTGNSARSQIAEALISTLGGRRERQVVAASAGSRPAAKVHDEAIAALRRHGIAWQGQSPKSIDAFLGASIGLVITVCDHAREACPVLSGAQAQAHWGLPDPAAAAPADAPQAFERAYEALRLRAERLLELPLEDMAPADLSRAAQAIHDEASASAPTAR